MPSAPNEIKDIQDLLPHVDRTAGAGTQFWMDFGIIIAAAAVIAAGFMIWAVYFRSRKRHRRSMTVMGNGSKSRPQGKMEDHEIELERRHRHRHRRPRYTHRNPTRAEVGGLPPIRPDAEPPATSTGSQLPS